MELLPVRNKDKGKPCVPFDVEHLLIRWPVSCTFGSNKFSDTIWDFIMTDIFINLEIQDFQCYFVTALVSQQLLPWPPVSHFTVLYLCVLNRIISSFLLLEGTEHISHNIFLSVQIQSGLSISAQKITSNESKSGSSTHTTEFCSWISSFIE